jgi:puromycin-sensitive aminopeptidase
LILAATESGRLPRCASPTHYDIDLEPDLEQRVFNGRVAITLDVSDATNTLTLNAVDLAIHDARLEHVDGRVLAGNVGPVPVEQQVDLVFPEALPASPGYRLTLSFGGVLGGHLRGLYRSTFVDDEGRERAIATTQFEPSDARRAFPCWDEPNFKATFQLRLVVAPGLTALSNSPEESREDLGDGRWRVTFEKTIRMSTYLVALVMGPYVLTDATEVNGVPVRIAAVPGKSHLSGYARDVAVHSLRFLAGYFGIEYPGTKIDHVAVPDFSFGAMENFGCVTYRENVLLADPNLASQAELQRIATVVAHETSHMWFGDLVTMKWWNGIWLNEAFATFMENTTIDSYDRDWDVWASFGTARAAALTTDGLRAARAVEFNVGRPDEAEAMFDILTYQKGGTVLRMLEQFLGAETFRQGISSYLRDHAYGNTEATDLWDALEASSAQPVRAIMDSWIANPGHPLLTVDTGADDSTIELRQERFLYDGPSDGSENWAVPVSVRASAAGAVHQQRLLMDSPQAALSFDAPVDWVVVNDGAYGFYRVRYSPSLRQRIMGLRAQEVLAPTERLAWLSDTWAAVVAGLADLPEWVEVIDWFHDEDPDVWTSITSSLNHLAVIAGEGERPDVDAYIERIVVPVWARLGWEPRPGESRRRIAARAPVLASLVLLGGESRLKQEASRRFADFATGTGTLAPDLVAVAARIFVAGGGVSAWETMLDMYLRATQPQDKQRYLYALAETSDPALLDRTLDMTLTDEIRTQDAPFVVGTAMSRPGNAPGTWTWVEAHWEEVSSRYPSTLLVRALDGIAYLTEPAIAAGVRDFCRHDGIPSAGPRLDQLLERMDITVALTARLRGTLSAALGTASKAP